MQTQDLRLDGALDDLAATIARLTAAGDGTHPTPLRGVSLGRASAPHPRVHSVTNPCICLVAQGKKRVVLGDEVLVYDRFHFLVGSVDLPISGQVVDASPERPLLAVKLDLDMREVTQLLLDVPDVVPRETAPTRGLFVSRVAPEIVEAFGRLVRLAETPGDIPALEAGMRREAIYRVLKSEQGVRLRALAGAASHSPRIAKSIEWLRENFRRPLRVEALAALANMSPSSFHEHFRATTAMSPLQFQKQLRLQEARQLLMEGVLDAATVGHRVGYESPSQFSREYSRLFGAPPATDMKRLRGDPAALPRVGTASGSNGRVAAASQAI
jgi:AraC-like DNA-binding protein